jgi:hypothetical protein
MTRNVSTASISLLPSLGLYVRRRRAVASPTSFLGCSASVTLPNFRNQRAKGRVQQDSEVYGVEGRDYGHTL